LASELLEKLGTNISELTLIPSSGGVFEIKINDQLIYSKISLGHFPGEGEILSIIESL